MYVLYHALFFKCRHKCGHTSNFGVLVTQKCGHFYMYTIIPLFELNYSILKYIKIVPDIDINVGRLLDKINILTKIKCISSNIFCEFF